MAATQSGIKVHDSKFNENSATENGGAIYADSPDVSIVKSEFNNNTADNNGGAVYWKGDNGKLEDSTFEQNEANNGGAVLWNGYRGYVKGCEFNNNSADSDAGAIRWLGDAGYVDGCTFDSNNAFASGAVMWDGSQGTIFDSTFLNNYADWDGGAINVNGADKLTIDQSTFTKNHVKDGNGGAIYSSSSDDLTVIKSDFIENSAEYGGAICQDKGSNLHLSNTYFDKNNASNGGALYIYNSPNSLIDNQCNFINNEASYGGAAYILSSETTISGTEFRDNTAKGDGGAVYCSGNNNTLDWTRFFNNHADNLGGALFLGGPDGYMSYCAFEGNDANDGGAVYWSGNNGTITRTSLNNNHADNNGGAIYWYGQNGHMTENNWMDGNDAEKGGAVYWNGNDGTFDYSDHICNNKAEQGGAFYWNGDRGVINNTKIEANHANEGGAIYYDSVNAILNNSEINYNGAVNGGGLYIDKYSNNAIVNHSSFYLNDGDIKGGAIYWDSPNGKLDNSYFNENWVSYLNPNNNTSGGAVHWHGDNATVTNSKFVSNHVLCSGEAADGGALNFQDHYANVTNCDFEDNTAQANGGAIHWAGDHGTIYNSRFVGNNASSEGGAIEGVGENILINASTFTKNNAWHIGGAISLNAYGTIDDCNFTENYAHKGGAVHWIDEGLSVINNSYFYKNHATYAGGAVSCDYNYFQAEKYIQNCVFEENNCVNYGGAVASLDTEMDNCTFINNNARMGGAVHSYDSKIVGSHFSGNTAVYGNDFYHSNELDLIDTEIPEENIVFVPSELAEIVDYTVGNSTRLMNNSYIGMCFERWSLMPKYGAYDESLHALINVLTGESIVEYLKLLVYDSFNSMDDAYSHDGDNFTLYPEWLEGDSAAMNDKSNWVNISRTDYYSRVVHIFSDCDFRKSEHPEVKRILALYDNGTRIHQDETKVVNGSTVVYHFSTLISPASQSLFLFLIEKPNMTVNKTYLNNSHVIYVDDVVAFNITVTNNGKGPLSNVTVEEIYNPKELQFVGYSDNSTWNKTGNIFAYNGNISAGKNVTFTVWFKTLTNGTLINNVTAKARGVNGTPANNSTVVYKRITVNVTKVWDDADNQDGVRPNNVTVILLADDVEINRTELSEKNNWTDLFKDLPVFNDENKTIKYSIQELAVANYEAPKISKVAENNWTVVNTHVPEVTSVNVTKIWNDNANQDGIRPKNITVVLFNDTGVVAEIVLNAANSWKGNFSNLPVYINNGTLINYTVAEKVVPKGYVNETAKIDVYNYIITNNHTAENTSVNVTKFWNDAGNQDGIRPVSITVVLMNDTGVVAEHVLNADNGWKYTFRDLPVYVNNGTLINYSVIEKTVPKGYVNEIVKTDGYNYVITNNHTPELTSVNVTKNWIDNNNQDGVRPANITVVLLDGDAVVDTAVLNESNHWKYSFKDLPVYKNNGTLINYTVKEFAVDNYTVNIDDSTRYVFIINNTHAPEVTSVDVAKIWDDADNQDGVRPASVTVVLSNGTDVVATATLNASNNWSASFTDLPVYNNGELIKYSVEELKVANYTSVVSAAGAYSFVVNNTHVPVLTNVSVVKVWDDNGNRDGVRPASVTVVLSNGTDVVATATLNDSNDWSASFTDLPVYNNGKLIEYSINELEVANYTSIVSVDGAYSFTVVNSHVPVLTNVSVVKVWDDNGNRDGVRPVSVDVVLLADGNVVGTATLNANNNWYASFEELPVYNNGKLISYSVEELEVANYTSVVSSVSDYSFIVNNTHVPVVTSVDVTKVWNDANDQDGVRPAEVTVVLVSDGKVINTAVLNANNNWHASFKELPVYSNGELIKYSVEEISVANYTSVVSSDSAYSFIVNNTHVPLITVVNITKVWRDDNNKNEEPVKVIIYADGVEVANVTLYPGNDWKFTYDDLPAYKDGKKINYTIGVVEGNRTVNMTGDNGNFTIIAEPVYNPDMTVQKITLDTEVEVGDLVSFEIVVENTGDCDLTGIYVIDNEYSEGLVFEYMEPNDDWTYEGNGKFTYNGILGVGESTSFIVVFTATTVGFKVNTVTAGNNLTNKTVNSTNTTNVTEEVPPEPDVPEDEPDVPQKHHVPKHVKPDKHATGNPILLLLLALVIPIIRRKQK